MHNGCAKISNTVPNVCKPVQNINSKHEIRTHNLYWKIYLSSFWTVSYTKTLLIWLFIKNWFWLVQSNKEFISTPKNENLARLSDFGFESVQSTLPPPPNLTT